MRVEEIALNFNSRLSTRGYEEFKEELLPELISIHASLREATFLDTVYSEFL